MWADNETSEDLLGFKIHADMLIDVINDNNILPVTIGVFGDWGSGKSSILKILHKELSTEEEQEKGTLVLYFNGWVFEGYDDAKAALMESIIVAFDEHKTIGSKVKDITTKLFKSVKWMRMLGLGFKKIILPSAAAYMTGGLSLIPHLKQEFSNYTSSDLAEKLTGDDTESFLKEIIDKKEDPENTLVRKFRADFEELLNRSNINKLIVIIDDLDRCSPDRLIENLEAIKLFLNVNKTAFIIGADPRIVRHAIELRYKTDGITHSPDANSRNNRIVSDYLEKLIQIPYNLPKLSDSEVETYMTLLFCKKHLENKFETILKAFNEHKESNRYDVFGIGNISEILAAEDLDKLNNSISLIASLSTVITEGLNGNPRQIKRFLNTFTLRHKLASAAKIPDFKVDILAKLMVLEYSSPNLFREVYNWQARQKGIPTELAKLEENSTANAPSKNKDTFSSEWQHEKIVQWLNTEPKLANIDLRDYFWISRDQLDGTISGASLISIRIRELAKKIIEGGSGIITDSIISQEVNNKLTPSDTNTLLSLLSKELIKSPQKSKLHQVFISLILSDIHDSYETYVRAIKQMNNKEISFSLRNDFILAAKKNKKIESLYKIFDKDSDIYTALNTQQ